MPHFSSAYSCKDRWIYINQQRPECFFPELIHISLENEPDEALAWL